MDVKNNCRKYLFGFYLCLSFLFCAVVFGVAYWNYQNHGMYIFPPIAPATIAELGQLGDYFGGLLNPIFGAATIILVSLTFFIQKQQLDVAKKEHKINLLQNEFRYLFSEVAEMLQKNGIYPDDELLGHIIALGGERGRSVAGDLNGVNCFSYYKLACLIMCESESASQLMLRGSFRREIEADFFKMSRLVIYCRSANCLGEVSIELIDLLGELSGIKLNIQSEVGQVKEIFEALAIDYIQTAVDGKKIIWM